MIPIFIPLITRLQRKGFDVELRRIVKAEREELLLDVLTFSIKKTSLNLWVDIYYDRSDEMSEHTYTCVNNHEVEQIISDLIDVRNGCGLEDVKIIEIKRLQMKEYTDIEVAQKEFREVLDVVKELKVILAFKVSPRYKSKEEYIKAVDDGSHKYGVDTLFRFIKKFGFTDINDFVNYKKCGAVLFTENAIGELLYDEICIIIEGIDIDDQTHIQGDDVDEEEFSEGIS